MAKHRKPPKTRILNAADERAATRGFWFDKDAAARAVSFFETLLKHSKGRWANKPFILQKWQKRRIVEPLFGWKGTDGFRRFRKGYIEIPKKNGKTTMCAGLELYFLIGDDEPGAEVYSAAVDRKQASLIFDEAAHMVDKSPALRKRLRLLRANKRIVYHAQAAFFAAMSGDSGSNEGPNAHAVLVDELHAHKTRALYDSLVFSGAAREQPFFGTITTAGWDRESICWEQHEYAKGVLAGEIEDDRFLAVIYGFDDDEEIDILDPKVHKRANPSYGTTVFAEELMGAAREAVASPRKTNTFKRYRLNIWTESVQRWLTPEAWAKCGVEGKRTAQEIRAEAVSLLRGKRCFAGLDLGATSDLTALVFLFPDGIGDGRPFLLPFFWLPREGDWRKNPDQRANYETWVSQGFMTYTDGNTTDYRKARADLNDLGERFNVVDVAVDRLFQGSQLCTELQEDGFEVTAFGQGFYSMAAPSKRFEERVLDGEFNYGNNPVLAWMARNATVKEDDAGNIKPVKPSKNSGRKIDGIVASLMALGRWMAEGEASQGDIGFFV